ncbi:MAG: hypothetical protein OXF56_26355, partial [Rhodobacteraceae bacterium]|nr:hypothetical protein [Paracoccaceae bacterium]
MIPAMEARTGGYFGQLPTGRLMVDLAARRHRSIRPQTSYRCPGGGPSGAQSKILWLEIDGPAACDFHIGQRMVGMAHAMIQHLPGQAQNFAGII